MLREKSSDSVRIISVERDKLLDRLNIYFDLPVGVDLLVYTQDQVTSRLLAGDEFMTRVWKESRVLAADRASVR